MTPQLQNELSQHLANATSFSVDEIVESLQKLQSFDLLFEAMEFALANGVTLEEVVDSRNPNLSIQEQFKNIVSPQMKEPQLKMSFTIQTNIRKTHS